MAKSNTEPLRSSFIRPLPMGKSKYQGGKWAAYCPFVVVEGTALIQEFRQSFLARFRADGVNPPALVHALVQYIKDARGVQRECQLNPGSNRR